MGDRQFDPVEFQDGLRCGCCREIFQPGDEIANRFLVAGEFEISTPVCVECDRQEAPLCADHPCGPGRSPVFRADGSVVFR